MLRLPMGRCFFALIKANKPKNVPDLTPRDINGCRQLLGMPPCQRSTIAQKASSYLRERANSMTPKLNADAIYRSWQVSKPLQCEIGILAFSQKMTAEQDAYLYKIVEQWGRFLLDEQSRVSKGPGQLKESYRTILIQFFQTFNGVCYLLNLDQNMIQIYLRIYQLAQSHKVQDKNYSHLRYVLDHLLKLQRIPQHNLQFMLSFTSKFPMQSVYHQKEREILGLIYGSLPKFKTENKRHYKLMVNLLHSMSIQSEISASMKALALHIYNNFGNPYVRFKAFSTLIDIFLIHKGNIAQKENLSNLKSFMKEFPKIAFKQLPKYFYRADIWLEEFWLPYFEYVSIDDNYKELETFHHFVIDDLLGEGGVGGAKLQKTALSFREFLRGKGTQIRQFDIRKEYERSFGRIQENKASVQMHVANSMRLICSAQILTEVAVKYFIVDVLVDQRVVVEINNSHHYKTIDGVTALNLKSQFRERVLERNGYKCYNIRVDDLSASNYSMLEEIHRIVQSSSVTRNG